MQVDDQGLVNTDPRYIAVPNAWVNLIPTNVNGLTFSRTPQMVRAYSSAIALPPCWTQTSAVAPLRCASISGSYLGFLRPCSARMMHA